MGPEKGRVSVPLGGRTVKTMNLELLGAIFLDLVQEAIFRIREGGWCEKGSKSELERDGHEWRERD